MANGKLVWLNFENIDALSTLTKSFDVKSPNNVVSILVDLAQKTKDIQLKQMRLCPTCNKEFEIEENTSRAYKLKDHIRHCDLEDTICKQTCKIQHRVKLGSNGNVISNKTVANGATTTKDEQIIDSINDLDGPIVAVIEGRPMTREQVKEYQIQENL